MEEINGKTRYGRICKLLKPIVGKELELIKLRRRIMIDIGSSPNVISESINLMIELGLIQETTNPNRPMNIKYKILMSQADM